MMRYIVYIMVLVAFSNCSNADLEKRWEQEIEHSLATSKSSFQIVNKFFQFEEERNIEDFRRQIIIYPFNVIGEEAIYIENRFNHTNDICDKLLLELDNLYLNDEFNYSDVRNEICSLRDTLVQFIASYTDDKGMTYNFDATEIDENGDIAKQLQTSLQLISPRDTSDLRIIYNLLKLPNELLFEENETNLGKLQKQMFLYGLITSVKLARSFCENAILSRFYSPCGMQMNKIKAMALVEQQVLKQEDTLALKIRVCRVDTSFKHNNYYSILLENQLFTGNSISIESDSKGFQNVSGTAGIVEKVIIIQKPWSYQYFGK